MKRIQKRRLHGWVVIIEHVSNKNHRKFSLRNTRDSRKQWYFSLAKGTARKKFLLIEHLVANAPLTISVSLINMFYCIWYWNEFNYLARCIPFFPSFFPSWTWRREGKEKKLQNVEMILNFQQWLFHFNAILFIIIRVGHIKLVISNSDIIEA